MMVSIAQLSHLFDNETKKSCKADKQTDRHTLQQLWIAAWCSRPKMVEHLLLISQQ